MEKKKECKKVRGKNQSTFWQNTQKKGLGTQMEVGKRKGDLIGERGACKCAH